MTIERPHDNCYWVIPGRFLASEYPTVRHLDAATDRLPAYLRHGLDTFIDLTEPHELEPYVSHLELIGPRFGIQPSHHRFPITDRSVPDDKAYMVRILDAIDEQLELDRNLCVHCWGGIGRTGLVVGCHLVRRGMTGEQALAQIAEWWTQMEKRHRMPRAPETDEQRAYVRAWSG
jgi:hypothetical protein